jgi:arsenate reductase
VNVTIYHNPACGTSRNTLALIRAAGIEPAIVEYLQTPPSRGEIVDLAKRMGLPLRDLLREKGTPFAELGLGDPSIEDDVLLDAIAAHPVLLNRPIVVAPGGVALCRPSELVLDLIPEIASDQVKEDGAIVVADRPVRPDDRGLRGALDEAGLSGADLSEPGRSFFAFRTLSGSLLGYGGFELHGADALIRSVVVAKDSRGSGVGRASLPLLLRRAFDRGARQAWLLTTDAAGFFEKNGFRRIERSEAPAEILATRQAAALCPASATLLTRQIRP